MLDSTKQKPRCTRLLGFSSRGIGLGRKASSSADSGAGSLPAKSPLTGRGESEISLVAPVVPSLAGVDWPGSRFEPRGSVAPVFFVRRVK